MPIEVKLNCFHVISIHTSIELIVRVALERLKLEKRQPGNMSTNSEWLRHFLASIAYYATKALKDAPDNYPELDIGKGVRTPRRLLHHIIGVLIYAHSFYVHYETTRLPQGSWNEKVTLFYETLAKLDKSISEGKPLGVIEEQLLQGPLSDSMAHIGQLLMLRRLSGSPVSSENFLFADIKVGQVGPNQPNPVAPDL